jgi:hypothetical protein
MKTIRKICKISLIWFLKMFSVDLFRAALYEDIGLYYISLSLHARTICLNLIHKTLKNFPLLLENLKI